MDNHIYAKGVAHPDVLRLPVKDSEVIRPGHLVAVDTGEWALQGAGDWAGYVAPASPERAMTAAYPDGEALEAIAPPSGAVCRLILANGQTIVIGDFLMAAAAGEVTKFVAQDDTAAGGGAVPIVTKKIIGVAREAITSTTNKPFIKVLMRP